MHSSSEVRFVLVFTMFFRCWTFCASNVRDTQKLRKNKRFGLPGRPGEARTSRFERQNDQVGRQSAVEAARSSRSRADRAGQGEPGRSAYRMAIRTKRTRLQTGKPRWRISLLIFWKVSGLGSVLNLGNGAIITSRPLRRGLCMSTGFQLALKRFRLQRGQPSMTTTTKMKMTTKTMTTTTMTRAEL